MAAPRVIRGADDTDASQGRWQGNAGDRDAASSTSRSRTPSLPADVVTSSAARFVCRCGRDHDFVTVLDLGLVKPVAHDQGPTLQALTAEAATRGTPSFMSPEQALADPTLDARSDIYAVGCVAFWLVTGKPVLEGTSPIDTIVKHVHVAPQPPSAHTTQEVPDAFDALVLACLAKDRGARPESADVLAAKLEAITPAGGWTQDDARTWWQAYHPHAGHGREHAPVGEVGRP